MNNFFEKILNPLKKTSSYDDDDQLDKEEAEAERIASLNYRNMLKQEQNRDVFRRNDVNLKKSA